MSGGRAAACGPERPTTCFLASRGPGLPLTHNACSQDTGGAAWRGRGALLGDVLRLHLAHRPDRVEAIRGLAAGELTQVRGGVGRVKADSFIVLVAGMQASSACTRTQLDTAPLPDPRTAVPSSPLSTPRPAQVPDAGKGTDAGASVDPFPCLCSHTIATWYRACFEQLQARHARGACGVCMTEARRAGWGAPPDVPAWHRACMGSLLRLPAEPPRVLPPCPSRHLQAAWEEVAGLAATAVKEGITGDEAATAPIIERMQVGWQARAAGQPRPPHPHAGPTDALLTPSLQP